jgi:hypothetical protein
MSLQVVDISFDPAKALVEGLEPLPFGLHHALDSREFLLHLMPRTMQHRRYRLHIFA